MIRINLLVIFDPNPVLIGINKLLADTTTSTVYFKRYSEILGRVQYLTEKLQKKNLSMINFDTDPLLLHINNQLFLIGKSLKYLNRYTDILYRTKELLQKIHGISIKIELLFDVRTTLKDLENQLVLMNMELVIGGVDLDKFLQGAEVLLGDVEFFLAKDKSVLELDLNPYYQILYRVQLSMREKEMSMKIELFCDLERLLVHLERRSVQMDKLLELVNRLENFFERVYD